MTDVLPPDQENHHFRNVGRVISNTLEVLGNKNNLQRSRDVLCVLHHVGKQLTKDLLVAIIDKPVVSDDFLGQFRIRVDERIQTVLKNSLRGFGHNGQVDKPLHLRFLDELRGAFGDIDRNIPDAFDVTNNLQCGRNKTQIASHGLLESQNLVAQVIDFDLEPIE